MQHDVVTDKNTDGEWRSVCSCGDAWTLKATSTPADITEKAQAHVAYAKREKMTTL